MAKREDYGEVIQLKSEYGNIFSREDVIKTLKKGVEYFLSGNGGRVKDKIYLISIEGKDYLSTTRVYEKGDKLKGIPNF